MSDAQDDITHRLKLSNLQGRKEPLEIERDALALEIKSPQTSQKRREEVFLVRDHLMSQWAEIIEELKIYEGKAAEGLGPEIL
jgi:hypothetical protein